MVFCEVRFLQLKESGDGRASEDNELRFVLHPYIYNLASL
jgi:hypothetical protein